MVEDIKTLNIDGVAYEVDAMSDSVKKMVTLFNKWNSQEETIRMNLLKIQCAKNDLSRQIILQTRKDLNPNEGQQEGSVENTTPEDSAINIEEGAAV